MYARNLFVTREQLATAATEVKASKQRLGYVLAIKLAFEEGMITATQALTLLDNMKRLGLDFVPANAYPDDPNWR